MCADFAGKRRAMYNNRQLRHRAMDSKDLLVLGVFALVLVVREILILNNIDNNERISRAPFHLKQAQVR